MAGGGMTSGKAEFFGLLKEGLEQPGEFVPAPYYNADADVLFFYARDVPSYAQRMNSLLTLILSTEDDSLVGIKVKSVKRILAALDDIQVHVMDHKIKLGILIAIAKVEPACDPKLASYENNLDQFDAVEIDKGELVGA